MLVFKTFNTKLQDFLPITSILFFNIVHNHWDHWDHWDRRTALLIGMKFGMSS